jgi:hypothetical protein
MYTGRIVKPGFFALVLALVLAATPVLSVLCEMDCDRALAGSLPCHEVSGSHDDATVRGAAHGCGHDHSGGNPARLASATGRDARGIEFPSQSPTLVYALLDGARLAAAATMHGPPGSTGQCTSSRLTVLRI